MVTQSDYRAVLRHALQVRSLKNPRYSLRAFARSLGIDPGDLSRVLSGKGKLSLRMGSKIASELGLSHHDAQLFMQSIVAEKLESIQSAEMRDQAASRRKSSTPLPTEKR